eukprot:m.704575 g.704575  ORF g.704575 m.704575 type:complete len:342 (-) comp58717_c1_seq2:582-1607(-)
MTPPTSRTRPPAVAPTAMPITSEEDEDDVEEQSLAAAIAAGVGVHVVGDTMVWGGWRAGGRAAAAVGRAHADVANPMRGGLVVRSNTTSYPVISTIPMISPVFETHPLLQANNHHRWWQRKRNRASERKINGLHNAEAAVCTLLPEVLPGVNGQVEFFVICTRGLQADVDVWEEIKLREIKLDAGLASPDRGRCAHILLQHTQNRALDRSRHKQHRRPTVDDGWSRRVVCRAVKRQERVANSHSGDLNRIVCVDAARLFLHVYILEVANTQTRIRPTKRHLALATGSIVRNVAQLEGKDIVETLGGKENWQERLHRIARGEGDGGIREAQNAGECCCRLEE